MHLEIVSSVTDVCRTMAVCLAYFGSRFLAYLIRLAWMSVWSGTNAWELRAHDCAHSWRYVSSSGSGRRSGRGDVSSVVGYFSGRLARNGKQADAKQLNLLRSICARHRRPRSSPKLFALSTFSKLVGPVVFYWIIDYIRAADAAPGDACDTEWLCVYHVGLTS